MEKTGTKRPWKSLRDFHFSHSFNNNKLDDRDHFLQNAKTSVASLRRLITPTRNADHDQPGTLITFIGIRTKGSVAFRAFFFQFAMHTSESSRRVGCPRVLPQENLADTLWLQKRVQAGPGTQVSEYPTRLRAHAV